MATRYSSVLISVGTPTFMGLSSRRVGNDHAMRLNHVHRGSGEPLLLVHGIGDSNRMWSRVLGRLARAHEVFAVDAPGFGGSAPLAGRPTIERLAAACAAFMGDQGHA